MPEAAAVTIPIFPVKRIDDPPTAEMVSALESRGVMTRDMESALYGQRPRLIGREPVTRSSEAFAPRH